MNAGPMESNAALANRGPAVSLDGGRPMPAAAASVLPHLERARVVTFLPSGSTPDALPEIPAAMLASIPEDAILPGPIGEAMPALTCDIRESAVEGWTMSASLARRLLASGWDAADWRLSSVYAAAERIGGIRFLSAPVADDGPPPQPTAGLGGPPLTRDARVLVVIPYRDCAPWLAECLASMVGQTRAPEGIVVIDDASSVTPAEICAAFPAVTLLRSAENVGPYRLVQQVMDMTDYDAFMFQDSDDWSAADRLELLLAEGERAGAELVGSQEIRVEDDERHFRPVTYPRDANLASSDKPRHPLLHPTSLVTGGLVRRLGGFASGLKFSGDTEFLYRALFDARVVNIPHFAYFRRKRPGALTTSPETGLNSPLRRALLEALYRRAAENKALEAEGRAPILDPICKADAIALSHVCGPVLTLRETDAAA